jgi:uncharacterized protein (UPF0261 family)
LLLGPVEDIPSDILKRKYVIHNPIHTHVKANHQEMFELGRFISERLGQSKGYATVFVPSRGFSQLNKAGGPIWEPEADAGFRMPGFKKVWRRVSKSLHLTGPASKSLICISMIPNSPKPQSMSCIG